MGIEQYLNNSVKVTRPTQNIQTGTTVPEDENSYADLGLPFYYYHPKLSILFIIVGIILFFANLFGPLLLLILGKRKRYRCVRCGSIGNNGKKCFVCGGPVIPLQDKQL